MTRATRPYPLETELNDGYLDGLRKGELRIQQCSRCGAFRFPPARYCPQCLSSGWSWTAVSGRATLWSWIRMHKRYISGFEPPYVVCLVELDEGPRMIAGVVPSAVNQLRCDQPVKACFDRDGDQVHLLFEPCDGTST